MNKIHKRRLNKLADFLSVLPRDKFKMTRWFNECGTPSCALGWSTTLFKRSGFYRVSNLVRSDFYRGSSLIRGSSLVRSVIDYKVPAYRDEQGYPAAEKFFGILQSESAHLFNPYNYPKQAATPKMVARRIRKVIALNESIR